MMRLLALAVVLLASNAAAAPDPFAGPVKDCRPCRISPGPGQPDFDLGFVFAGSGDHRALTGFDLKPAGGGPAQRLRFEPVAVADFPEGFSLGHPDINFDGRRDLSLVTMRAADNTGAAYWVYRPSSRQFVPLQRVNDGDAAGLWLSPMPDHRLLCHVKGDALEWTNYWYRVAGDRAVAVVRQTRAVQHGLVLDTTYNLAVSPPRVVSRVTVGFSGDSPQRSAFLKRFWAASRRAAELYRHGDTKAAVATVRPLLQDMELALLPSSYPVTDDPEDLRLVGAFNDYGFYLEQAGRPKDAIHVLSQVVDIDAGRIVAYLNLADAQYAAGDTAGAKQNYAEYRRRMTAAGKSALIPSRVLKRLR